MNRNTIDVLTEVLDGIEMTGGTAEDVAQAMDLLAQVKADYKTLEERAETLATAFITANGPVRMGKIMWCMSVSKTVKCNDPKETARTLLELGGLDSLMFCLSSGAIKHGAARAKLDEAGEDFAKHFTTIEKQDLKGEPIKELARIDTTFLKAKS